MNTPKKIDLLMLENGRWMAMIIRCQSGITFSNQTGGTACAQPTVEGILFPIPSPNLDDCIDPLEDYCGLRADNPRFKEFLVRFFQEGDFELDFDAVPDNCSNYGEAWIPARVGAKPCQAWLQQFAGHRVIITYANSD